MGVIDLTSEANELTVLPSLNPGDRIRVEGRRAKTISFELPKGTYILRCYGAQGGSTSVGDGGLGGYAEGTLTLPAKTLIYVNAGQKGSTAVASSDTTSTRNPIFGTVSFNGGGYGFACNCPGYPAYIGEAGSGGGASDIRIGSNSLYARVIVAGGGGGAAYLGGWNETGVPGNGGGLEGTAGTVGSPSYSSYVAYPGTQTSSGNTSASYIYDYNSASSVPSNNGKLVRGGFGEGANYSFSDNTSMKSSGAAGGGGGGWYGGFCGCRNAGAGAGGSGYVYTSNSAANYPSGCELNSSYYLTSTTLSPAQTAGDGSVVIEVVSIDMGLTIKTEDSTFKKVLTIYKKTAENTWETITNSELRTSLENVGLRYMYSRLP